MWGIHRRLQQEKAGVITEVESSIAAASRDHATESLSRLNALLERRAHLRGVHTWPMDLRGVSRVAFYLVIPPLAWVGAALVEILVMALLGAGGAP